MRIAPRFMLVSQGIIMAATACLPARINAKRSLADVAARRDGPPVNHLRHRGEADSHDVNHLFPREADFL